jgi:phage terminase small subunit
MPARKPVEVLELTGRYKHDPQRRRPPAPKSDEPIGGPPVWLHEHLKPIWYEFISQAPPGVLTHSDRYILAVACDLALKLRMGMLKGPEIAQLRLALVEMGMTPVARTRLVAVPPETPEDSSDPFLQFAN